MKPNTCNPIEQIAGKALFQNCAPNSCRRDSLTSICWQLIRLAFNHQEKFVKSGYKHVGICIACFASRYPYAFVQTRVPAKHQTFPWMIYGILNNCQPLDLSTLDIYLCSVVKYWGYEKGKRKRFNMKAKIRIARLLQYLLFFIPVKKNRIMFYANNRKGYVCNPSVLMESFWLKHPGRIRTYLGHPFSGNLYDADRNYSRAPAKLKLF